VPVLAAVAWGGALVSAGAAATPTPQPPSPAPEVQELARIELAALPPAPFFVGLAQVVVPPGSATTTAGTAGPRLLVVEAGTLTVDLGGDASDLQSPRAATGEGGGAGSPAAGNGSVTLLGPGDRLALGPGAVRAIWNDGGRPAVYYDAALFPAGPRPPPPAFTTPEGISFRLLAGVIVETPPPSPATLRLERITVPPAGRLPAAPRLGPALGYVESGSLRLEPTGGSPVQYARAAAPAPFSSSGPMRTLDLGAKVTLTAGTSLFLPTGSAIEAANERALPALLLVVDIG
jgi:hypothetical protein